MRISKKQFISITFLLFWGIIALSMTTGLWKSKMQGIEIHQDELGTGAVKEKIKGWMKVKAIEKMFGVPINYVCNELDLPQNINQELSIKDLKNKYGFEMDELRKIVVKYNKQK
ncbi:MAG: hypothetical protein AWU54_2295 [Candidatus Frackibacter sp. T328-2]|nr:MAG: hypothetical protein AWU54_2295 [Candidatus Frackibacter sp. T328-2]